MTPAGPDVLGTAALAEAADENLVVHATWALAGCADAAVRVDPDLVVADSGIACDTFNFVCRARLDRIRAAGRVREAVAHFGAVRIARPARVRARARCPARFSPPG